MMVYIYNDTINYGNLIKYEDMIVNRTFLIPKFKSNYIWFSFIKQYIFLGRGWLPGNINVIVINNVMHNCFIRCSCHAQNLIKNSVVSKECLRGYSVLDNICGVIVYNRTALI